MAAFRSWYLLIFPLLVLLHLRIAPFSKVEESFNIQAIHDVLEYGIPISDANAKFKKLYDHMTFSGSVPRTFIGALIVSCFTQPVAAWFDLNGLPLQTLARAVLGLINAFALCSYAKAVASVHGRRTALWYIALQSSQFHVIYYASRTLPNSFAIALSTFALAAALHPAASPQAQKRNKISLYLLTLAAVIFRSEVALLLGAQTLNLFLKAQNLRNCIALLRTTILPAVFSASIVGIMHTVIIDTFFWQSRQFLWPEAAAFLFNIFPSEGHLGASAWGTLPWYWYFASAIPRLISSPGLLLLPYGLLFTTQRYAILDQLIPSLTYTIIYSFLPHKETRFLFPVVPQLTLAVALTISYISVRRQTRAKLITAILTLSTITSFLLSHAVLLPISAQSYPGAEALRLLHQRHYQLGSDRTQLNVYLTNFALQTGITRFLEQPLYAHTNVTFGIEPSPLPEPIVMPGSPDGRVPPLTYYPKSTGLPERSRLKSYQSPLWKYEKIVSEVDSEISEQMNPSTFWDQFDYVIVENPARFYSKAEQHKWSLVAAVSSLSHGRPRLVRKPQSSNELLVLRNGQDTTYDEIDSTDSEMDTKLEADGIYSLLERMYGRSVAWLYAATHDILVHGAGIGGVSLTRGYWIDYHGLENRLHIFTKRTDTGFVESDGGDDAGDDLLSAS